MLPRENTMLQQKNKTPIALHVQKKKVEYDDEILRGVA
jgi:hypothetical protein